MNFTKDTWQHIYKHIYQTTNNNILTNFQLKLLHRCLPRNRILCKVKKANDEKCNFCKDLPDSLIHIYATCRITKYFWNQVTQFINGLFEHPISLNITEIIFGTFLHESSLVSFLILLAK